MFRVLYFEAPRMESMILLSLIAALVVAPAVSLESLDGSSNSSQPVPILSLNIGRIFPFFGPVDFDAERDQEPLDDTIDPMVPAPASNDSDPSGGIVSIRVMEVFAIRDPSQEGSLDEPTSDFGQPLLQKFLDNILADIGLLDLSGKNMTSMEVYEALRSRKEQGRPVTTLILSNSRIHPMDAGTFAAAENTIKTLVMTNTSVNLDALRGLTSLKVLNLSGNALTTFPWYVNMANTLEVLDLSNNKFDEVRPELSMLRSLRELYLANNNIMFVEEAPLSMLPNLETLDLTMNVLDKADFTSLSSLKRLDVDWNFLRLMGTDCRLPPQTLSLRLASNPWRCDCGLLQSRDANQVMDLDQLQCVMMYSNNQCPDCERSFLPDREGLRVAALTQDVINQQGCSVSVSDSYTSTDQSKDRLRVFTFDVDKLVEGFLLFVLIFSLTIFCLVIWIKRCCNKRAYEGKVWVQPHDIPKWSFDKLGKPQEVTYIKIDQTQTKS